MYALTNEERIAHLETVMFNLIGEAMTLTIISNVDGEPNPEALREARTSLDQTARLVRDAIEALK
jgi:hypothetical protein